MGDGVILKAYVNALSLTLRKHTPSYSLDWETSTFFQPGKRKCAGVCSIERQKSPLEHVNSAFIQEGSFQDKITHIFYFGVFSQEIFIEHLLYITLF